VGNSDDSAGVCVAQQDTRVQSLRANSEDICQEAADAWEAYMRCAIEEGCDAWEILESECKDELGDYLDLLNEADRRCEE
jgi:NTP pyrophosphatase (non-canonical NTP hydrolase)